MVIGDLIRPGSVWVKGNRAAIVVEVPEPAYDGVTDVLMRTVKDGVMTGPSYWVQVTRGGRPTGYKFRMQTPALRCVDTVSAEFALAFLRGRGIVEAFVAGVWLVAPMTPPSVLAFAEEALGQGWAHDEDCAQMIGDLG